jgi:predicted PurR-regulated permease PerM
MTPDPDDYSFFNRTVEATIRIGILIAMAAACFTILSPFLMVVLWAVIIAVAINPMFDKLVGALGGRRKTAAALLVLVAAALVLVPTFLLMETLVDGFRSLADALRADKIHVPPPPDSVADWPLIGQRLHHTWSLASENLESAVAEFHPHLNKLGGWIASTAAGVVVTVLLSVLALVLTGVFLSIAQSGLSFAHRLGRRLSGERGVKIADLSVATIRSVAQGVIGVAFIQSVLAGIGMLVAGVPGAGAWALLVLVLAIAQLPPALVLIPVAIYVFSHASTVGAVLFLIWAILVSISDSFLKPLLMGRGVDVPMLVILIGAIGGMMAFGIIGLFVGAVVLAVGYQLFIAWLNEKDEEPQT